MPVVGSRSDADQGRRPRGVRSAARRPGDRPGRAARRRGARAARRLRRLPHRPLHGVRRRPVRLRADGARARGRRRRRAGRRRRHLARARRPRRHALLAAVPRVHPLPERPHEPLPRDPRAAEQGLPARRDDAPLARRRADPPLHGHLDVRGVHGDARDRAREGQPGGTARGCGALRLRALDRDRRRDEHREGRRRARRASSSAPAWSGSAR